MLELLQKTLLFIEEQNEWLLYIRSTIQEKQQHYKSLHSMITKEILKEVRKQDVVDSDDVKMEQDEVVVKEECCDVADIEISPLLNFQEPSEVTSNVDGGTSIDQIENNDELKYEGDNSDEAIIKEGHYQIVTDEANEHRDGVGVDVTGSTENTSKHNAKIDIEQNYLQENNFISEEKMKLNFKEPANSSSKSNIKSNLHQCTYCSKTFSSGSPLKRHLRTHTGEKPYKCNYCEKLFSDIGSRNRHLLLHTGEKPYKCGYCIMSFRQTSGLYMHLRTHTGEKPYTCDYCEKSFRERRCRNRHLLVHTGEKPYKCDYCEKSFRERRYRNRHLLVHTGAKRYKCEYCGKSFSRIDAKKFHLSLHTGVKP